MHGKQHKCPLPPTSFQPLDSLYLEPGDCISGDQLESIHPGLIPTYKGSPSTSFYNTGILFVEHESLFFSPHICARAKKTMLGKHKYEFLASGFNCNIIRYHFASKLFHDSCLHSKQKLTFYPIDAHHQNGIVESYIRTCKNYAHPCNDKLARNCPRILLALYHSISYQY
jgi:hypothetical protein